MRSGYHTTRSLLNESSQEGEGSNVRPSNEVWVKVWKFHIPNKIKVFMWRACHNVLPMLERLRQRQIIENEWCPICKRALETIIHALWEFGVAQDIWARCPHCVLQKGLAVQDSVIRLVEELMHKLLKDALEFFLVQSWLLWHRCN